MELLIALEMSRLQMIEDEARRRQSLLQEHSREQHYDAPHEFSGLSPSTGAEANNYTKGINTFI